MRNVSDAEARIHALVRMVIADPPAFGVLSTGERIAVALVLDSVDLLEFWGSTLECVERLGPEWTRAALQVQRNMDDEQ
jgi:hypothetical protein